MKRLLSLIIAMVFAVSMTPSMVAANEDESIETFTEGDWVYALEDDSATLLDYIGNDPVVNIPPTLGGKTLKTISGAAPVRLQDELSTEVIIPDSVTTVDWLFFNRCHVLRSITLGSGVRYFTGTYGLFCCCSLRNIYVSEDNPYYASINGVLYDKTASTLVRVPTGDTYYKFPQGVTAIADGAFANCQFLSLGNSMPDEIICIGEYTFYGCSRLTNITLPKELLCIGRFAFWGCTRLWRISIPDKVSVIDEYAFAGCTGLSELTIPDNVVTLNEEAFGGCTALHEVYIGSGLSCIGDGNLFDAFYQCLSLENIFVSEQNATYKDIDGILFDKSGSTLIIYPRAREGSYTVPSHVTTLRRNAFFYCMKLTELTIPSTVTAIEGGSIYNCESLERLYLYADIQTLPMSSFNNNPSLELVVLSDSIAEMDMHSYIFINCRRLESVIFLGDSFEFRQGFLENEEYPPEGDSQPDYVIQPATLYYLPENASSWAPNGETTWLNWNIQPLQYGNVDGNDAIDAADAAAILRHVVKLSALSSQGRIAADVDMDGKVTAADAAKILRFLVKLEPSL
ncbi:MAG: leucine-rich repeat protein [Eubacteriales bacterium]|nr:leucine-rich repeat protein [Eubacteriales bacterium]